VPLDVLSLAAMPRPAVRDAGSSRPSLDRSLAGPPTPPLVPAEGRLAVGVPPEPLAARPLAARPLAARPLAARLLAARPGEPPAVRLADCDAPSVADHERTGFRSAARAGRRSADSGIGDRTFPGIALRATRERVTPNGKMSGGVLLSHAVARAVPSALKGLASGFGMGPGVSLSL
jgi:hypothetical protein